MFGFAIAGLHDVRCAAVFCTAGRWSNRESARVMFNRQLHLVRQRRPMTVSQRPQMATASQGYTAG
jgi:hypothetical protein